MKIKNIIIFFIIIIFIISSIFILNNMIKKRKIGNTMNSQEIVDKILNLNSYSGKVFVRVKSNKNENKYVLLQEYNTENGCVQEVLEPSNISGIKIIKKDNKLSIQNSALNLNTIFENYNGLEDNSLDLINFITDYKQNTNSNYEEKEEEIIMKTYSENNNKYLKNKILYINKATKKPSKLIIQDNNQNTTIIIEYNEIELN